GAQVRVDEVHLDVAPGQLAVAVDVLGEGLDPLDGALEQARLDRVVHVGDHRDPDRVRRDPDVAVRRPLVLLRSGCRRHQPRPHRQCDGHECPQAPLHRSPLATVSQPPGASPVRGIVSRIETCFKTGYGRLSCPAMASPVAARARVGAIDLLDGDLYAGDPDATYSWLRRHAPLYRDEVNRLWGVSRYHDVVAIEKDPETFCSSEGYRPNLPADDSMIGNDDPRHNERRRLVSRRFTPKAVAGHEDTVREVVRGLVDAVAGKGRCAVVEALAAPLPALVVGRLLGFDDALWPGVKHWSETTIVAGGGPRYMNDGVAEAFADYCEHAARIMEARQRTPADDVMSSWMQAEAAGGRPPHPGLSGGLLLVGGGGRSTPPALTRRVVGPLYTSDQQPPAPAYTPPIPP